jgi:ligand-binding sensor domain-containing protein/signal transduction histidine kinase
MNRWWLLAAALCGGALQIGTAASPPPSVDVWTEKNGLPQNEVFAVTQTRDGYLWLGMASGLSRFDGFEFKSYEDREIPGLNGSRVGKIFEDSGGNLWLGTGTAGVMLVAKDGKISTILPPKGMSEGHLVAIAEDTAGGVWLSMAGGQLYRYAEGAAHLIADHCRNLATDSDGIVWTASPDGRLLGLGPMSKTTSSAIAVSYDPPVGVVDFLLGSKRGGYWRLANGRVQKFRDDQLQKDLGNYPWRPGTLVSAACEDQEGNLIVGTDGDGVWWFDAAGNASQVKGLSHSYIFSLAMDREGALWVGTNGSGLDRVRHNVFQVLDKTSGLTVQSVALDNSDGLWVGFNGDHVDHWRPSGVRQFYASDFVTSGPFKLLVRTVYEDKAGRVWVGSAAGSLADSRAVSPCLFQFQDGQFRPVPGVVSPVNAIFQDSRGSLWLGMDGGLARQTNGSWDFYTTRDGLSTNAVRAIAEDSETNLWVGTDQGGLNRFANGKFTTFRRQEADGLPSDTISALLVDRAGVLWVGTPSGLARFHHGQWTRYRRQDGLHSDKIAYLIEDNAGYLWIGSSGGLMRVLLSDLNNFADGKIKWVRCRTFGAADGLPTGECTTGSQPGPCRMPGGELWFPTILGVVGIDPDLLKPNTNPPPVVIEAVYFDNQLQSSEALRAGSLKSISVPAGKESLQIDFACLNLSNPEKGRVRYQLKGHENTATERPARDRTVHYSNLAPGDYEFEVTACNEDGFWNATGASLAIQVLPAFWQTKTFLALVIAGFLAATVGLVYYISTQRLQRQLATMRQHEALEKERARIARDLHDQLGANLTQVALLGEMAESDKDLPGEVESHARQICQTARDTTHALDEIVWTVNPSNDTLDGLLNYVCKYAQDYFALAGLRYRLEAPSELPNTPISPELRHNVFLVAKEAINNVVKHAQATEAVVRLALEPGFVKLEIEDNGKGLGGMDEKAASLRNGLRNMRKRMEDVGGSFVLAAAPAGGTLVRLVAPLAKR